MEKWKRTRKLSAVLVSTTAFMIVAAQPTTAATSGLNEPLKQKTAYILVDNDTGNVLTASNERIALPPASITKLLTALVAVSKIDQGQQIVVSPKAASMPPMKIGLGVGQKWTRDDLLHCLLMVSANDAAVALAEASSGTLEQFALDRLAAAKQLGLQDNPIFNDPSGLDDGDSHNGGDSVSARDMAIVARAALADPMIASIAATKKFEFYGGDHDNHTLRNHNKMLVNYDGAIGMKTGYTSKARNTMVAAATRNGRTMLAVVLGGESAYGDVTRLLDQGFALPVGAKVTGDHIPLGSLDLMQATDEVREARPTVAKADSDVWSRRAGFVFIMGFLIVLLARYKDGIPLRMRQLTATEPVNEPVK